MCGWRYIDVYVPPPNYVHMYVFGPGTYIRVKIHVYTCIHKNGPKTACSRGEGFGPITVGQLDAPKTHWGMLQTCLSDRRAHMLAWQDGIPETIASKYHLGSACNTVTPVHPLLHFPGPPVHSR